MRILHVRSSRGYYGAEALIAALAAGQARQGDDVTVAALVDAREPHIELVERLEGVAGVRACALPSAGRLDASVALSIATLAVEHGADLIHTHDYKTTLLGLAGAWVARLPVVGTFHGEVGDDARVRAYEAMARAALRIYDGVALVSPAQSGALDDPWRRRAPVVILNGLDVRAHVASVDDLRHNGRRAAWRRRLGLPLGAVVILTVGRLCDDKGQRRAFQEVAAALEAHPEAAWVMAGGGPDRAALEDEARRLGLQERVLALGHVEDMAEVYAGADVLLHPSLREGLPMAVLEAMASALPVVATAVGAIPEVVDPGVGALVEGPGQVGGPLRRLLADPVGRVAMGRAARARVMERHSAEALAASYRRRLYAPALGQEG